MYGCAVAYRGVGAWTQTLAGGRLTAESDTGPSAMHRAQTRRPLASPAILAVRHWPGAYSCVVRNALLSLAGSSLSIACSPFLRCCSRRAAFAAAVTFDSPLPLPLPPAAGWPPPRRPVDRMQSVVAGSLSEGDTIESTAVALLPARFSSWIVGSLAACTFLPGDVSTSSGLVWQRREKAGVW